MRVPALSGPDPTGSNNFNRFQLWTRRRVQSFTTLLLATGYGLLLRASTSTFDVRRVFNLFPRLRRCSRLVAFILLSCVGSWVVQCPPLQSQLHTPHPSIADYYPLDQA